MKDTGQGNQAGVRKKAYHCKNCGRIQSYTNFECESCGIDLGLYGKVIFLDDPRSLAEERRKEEERKRREKEEARKRAEAEKERIRQEKLRQQEEAKRKAEEERRLAEERRKEQIRAEAEARQKAEQERLQAEQRRSEQRKAEEAARKKEEEAARLQAEEERRLAAEKKRQEQRKAQEEARKRAAEEADRRRREQEAQEQAAAQKRQEKDEKRRQARENRGNQKKASSGKNSSNAGGKAKSAFLTVLRVLVCACIVFVLLMFFIGLDSRKCGENLRWSFDEETATLTIEGTGTMDCFAFAEDSGRMNSFPELEEAPWMEDYREEIQHVVIEPGAENIGDCAFADCVKLKDVVIPETVKTIGQLSFSNTALVNVTIPASVEKIENEAFGYISKLRNFIFAGQTPAMAENILQNEDERLVIVGNDPVAKTFAERRQIVYVAGKDVSSEGDFGGNSDDGKLHWSINLYTRHMTLTGSGPMEDFNGKWMLDEAENIKEWVEGRNFPYWTDYTPIIEKLVMEEGITRIGDSAFEQCHNMTLATLPNTLNYIGFQSFLSSGLKQITIPEGVTKIHDHAFNYCQKMVVVVLPESLLQLEGGTFNMCNALAYLTIGGNTEVQRTRGVFGVFSNGDNPDGRPEKLTIVGKLGSDAHHFAQEENFPFAPNGLKPGIEDSGRCGDNTRWKFVADERTLYIEGTGNTWSYHIDQQAIDDWAGDLYRRNQTREGDPEFLIYARYIEHIVVKKGVHTLGHNLFSWHDDPKLVNLKTVDYGSVRVIQAALKRTQLKYVEIPESVYGIDGCALADNDYLKTVVIRNGSEWIGEGLLYNCNSLTSVELHGKENIDDYSYGYLFNIHGDLPEWKLPKDLRLSVKPGSEGEAMARRLDIPYSFLN